MNQISKVSVSFQVMALILACAAILWGFGMVYSIAFPGPSGEWAGLAILGAYAVNIPAGLVALAIGLELKHGSPHLRRLCIVSSVVALCFPVLTSLVSWGQRHWN